jgi:hypothetical protein
MTPTGSITQTPTPTATETPTLVKVGGFRATSFPNGTLIQWQAGYQPSNLGFSVYREVNGLAVNGQKVLVTPNLIAGSALLTGPRISLVADRGYSWWDSYSNAGTRYWIKEYDLSGAETFYGPLVAAQGTGAAPTVQDSPILSNQSAGQHPPPVAHASAGAVVAQAGKAAVSGPVNLYRTKSVKLAISQPGWYRVPLSVLKTAGFNAGTGKNLHLYAEGNEQPFELNAAGVEFYGTGLDTPSTATRVYWLADGAVNKNHIAISTATGGPSAESDFLDSVTLRERNTYFPAANAANGIDYFGDAVSSTPLDEPALIALDLSRPDNAMLEVGLQGVTAGPHSVTVELNGVVLDTVSFNDLDNATFELPASSIENGANTVTLIAESTSPVDSLVDHLTLTYERTYTASQDQLEFSAGASDQVVVNGFSNAAVRMVDITNPSAPIELTVTATPNVPGSFTATVPGTGTQTILAFGADQIGTPDSITLHKASKLTPLAGNTNTIIITPASFISAVEPLIKQRLKVQKLHAVAVDIANVYDAFNFGEKDPQAIKSFLAATQTAKKPPHYVLLVGNASDDPRGFLTGETKLDLVPTKLINTDAFQALSDGWFADFQNTLEPQMAIGRLPAEVASDVTALVSKIIAYDSITPGNAFLLAADASDPGVEQDATFAFSNNSLVGLLPAGAAITEITRDPVNDNHAALIGDVNDDPDLVNFIGHGNISAWADNWLSDADATAPTATLTNQAHPAFFAMMTCLSGFFADPNQPSLAESLLEANNAVAVWASSGLTVPSGQLQADQTLYQVLFPAPPANPKTKVVPVPLGEAARQAQNSSSDPDVKQTWNLLGDPETNLR